MAKKVATPEAPAKEAKKVSKRVKKTEAQIAEEKRLEQLYKDIKPLVLEIQQDAIVQAAKKLADKKMKKQIAQVESIGKIVGERVYCKFSCEQLLRIFGGWFTCRYLFTAKNEKVINPDTGEEQETDFWICSQDVSMMRANERPPRNEFIWKKFGVEVYGYALIAPAIAF